MPEAKDLQLIEELIRASEEGRIRWTPTAKSEEFTASFKGKFSVVVAKVMKSAQLTDPPRLSHVYELRVLDESGNRLHEIAHPSVERLLNLARRSVVHVDRALDEILEELKSR